MLTFNFLNLTKLTKLLKKLCLVLFISILFSIATYIMSPSKAHANDWAGAMNSDKSCGAPSGANQFAGAVVDLFWVKGDGSHPGSRDGVPGYDADDSGVGVNVKTVSGGHSGLQNIIQYQAGQFENTMPRIDSQSWGQDWFGNCSNVPGAPERVYGVVLGYEYGTTGNGYWGNGWALDCDGGTVDFDVTGYGVPSGAAPNGTWTVTRIRPINGANQYLQLVYREPNYTVGRYDVYSAVNSSGQPCVNNQSSDQQATGFTIQGWALDPRYPGQSIDVHIYVDQELNAAPFAYHVTANQIGSGGVPYLVDGPPGGTLYNYNQSPYTNVGHGFSFTLPANKASYNAANPGNPMPQGVDVSFAALQSGNHKIKIFAIPYVAPSPPATQLWNARGNATDFSDNAKNNSSPWVTTINVNNVSGQNVLPTFCPWLRTQNGNVLALSDPVQMGVPPQQTDRSITDRQAGLAGSRALDLQFEPVTTKSSEELYQRAGMGKFIKEASYVIVARLGTDNFCSTNFYTLGNEYSNTAAINSALQSTCKSPTGGYDINQPMSQLSVYNNLQSVYNSSAIATNDCALNSLDVNQRYIKGGDMSNLPTAQFIPGTTPGEVDLAKNGGSSANKPCPTVYNYTSDTIIGSENIVGRATIARGLTDPPNSPPKDIYIIGDITYAPRSNFSNVNDVPNLAIVASGDVLIDPSVKRIDATIYAKGKIKTCVRKGSPSDSYPSPVCGKPVANEDRQLVGHGFWIGAKGFEWGRNYFEVTDHNYSTDPDFRGNAAERIIGNGWIIAYPPPGFEDAFTPNFTNVFYFGGELNPRF